MILSMTGYGRGSTTNSEYSITIDLKSVNHRFLELNFKLPKSYSFLEDKLRREISTKLSRGKIDVVISIERFTVNDSQISLNRPVVVSYLQAVDELKNEYQVNGEIDISTLVALPEVFVASQPHDDQEELSNLASLAINEAINAMIAMRQAEGENLKNDLLQKMTILQKMREQILVFAPSVVLSYKEKLTKRIQELAEGIEIDPNRIATEIAIFADKSDIHEELIRLDSHTVQFLNTLKSSEPVGRKLDFIIQEMNREINTIGSKANDLQVAQIVIDFKAELEKLREQVQNIE